MSDNKRIVGLHRPEGVEREEHDYYATHPMAADHLLRLLGWNDAYDRSAKLIRENSCGEGHLSKMIAANGHKVISTDLIDRGYGITGVDFLEDNFYDTLPYDATIMNPPYKYALEFIEKSLEQSPIVCAFLRLSFLESKKRKPFFERVPPHTVAVFSERMASSKGGKFSKDEKSTVAYAWFIWKRGHEGDTVIKWI
mgnify:CR=1 FL=1|tara:strand:- start:3996 stop:4583 length:588 start_codon:yes stop_codon:yes gene_type:complete